MICSTVKGTERDLGRCPGSVLHDDAPWRPGATRDREALAHTVFVSTGAGSSLSPSVTSCSSSESRTITGPETDEEKEDDDDDPWEVEEDEEADDLREVDDARPRFGWRSVM